METNGKQHDSKNSMTHAGVWIDDAQIDKLTIIRGPIGGMLKIEVEELEENSR